MNGRRAKENRKISADAKRQAMEAVRLPVNQALVNTANVNDRMEDVEEWIRTFSNVTCAPGPRGVWQRFRWFWTGR